MTIQIPELTDIINLLQNLAEENRMIKQELEALKNRLPQERKYSVNELSKLIGKRSGAVYRLFDKGLKYEVIGGHRYVTQTQLDQYTLEENRRKDKLLRL